MNKYTIEIIAVSYQQTKELKVFVQCVLNQTHDNWKLKVLHDGPSTEFEELMSGYKAQQPEKIFYNCTSKRYKDYGHSLREQALEEVTGDYVLLTNGDNYLIPKYVEYLNEALNSHHPDVVIYNMVHAHRNPGGRPQLSHCFFDVEYRPMCIDMGAAIVRSDLAKRAGFTDKTHDGDQTYFRKIAQLKPDLVVAKVPRVLFVHN